MLEAHFEQVQNLMLEMRSEYEERNGTSSQPDDPSLASRGLRSPPRFGGAMTPISWQGSAQNGARGPQLGIFSVTSPKSPRSPLKRAF
jgi:hypothetical protein